MPFYSDDCHSEPYREPDGIERIRTDIARLLESIQSLDIYLPTKRRMIVHALWEISVTTGNFYSQFRTITVISQRNLPIQRDHVFRKRFIVDAFLLNHISSAEVLSKTFVCIVTRDEHTRLHSVDPALEGWDRYRTAGIEVKDMKTGNTVV